MAAVTRKWKPHLQASFVSKILRIFILHSLSVDIPFNPTALEIHFCTFSFSKRGLMVKFALLR